MDLVIPTLFFIGTALQMATSVRDFKLARERELEWWNTEDELVEEIPRFRLLRRRQARGVLRGLRPPEVHAEIRHMSRTFAGWMLLWSGALLVLLQAVFR